MKRESKHAAARARIGVSACLLGERVRYDGGHKRARALTRRLEELVEWVRVCPETEMGLGVPREPMNLVGENGEHRLKTRETKTDHTDAMRAYAQERIASLARENLCGFILKSRSPSCGLEGVPVYDASGRAVSRARGFFTAALLERFPDLPIEEETRLADPRIFRKWMERVFAYRERQERKRRLSKL